MKESRIELLILLFLGSFWLGMAWHGAYFSDISALQREIESLVSHEPEVRSDSSRLPLIPEEVTKVASRVRSRSRK